MYLGIDLGTSGVKAVLVAENGRVLEQAQVPLQVSRPQPSWSEQNPEDWWQATDTAVRSLRGGGSDLKGVKAIGLSGQMHGATVLDKQGTPLRPAILWNDGRSAQQCKQLEQREPESREITGNQAMPGFTAPKLLWLQQHEPDIFKQIHKILLPKDYLRLQMTGDYASDMSDSAGTLWLNTRKRDWSDSMLDACGLTRAQMPELYEGPEPTANLRAVVAERWGLQMVPVVAGGGDNSAGAVGTGVVGVSEGLISLGTSGVYFVVSDGYQANTANAVHSFCHALPEKWHLMAVLLSGASCLEWLRNLTAADSAAQLLNELEVGADRNEESMGAHQDLVFLPYLSGERTPHNDPNARGVFFGLTHDHTRADLTRAVLEGVAFGLFDGQAALQDAGSEAAVLTLMGGGARSCVWRQILADILGKNLEYRDGGDVGPALGAARLAALAMAGGSSDVTLADICTKPVLLDAVEPNQEHGGRYQRLYAIYKNLYQNVCSLY